MEYVVITFLCAAILLYLLLGGADFGAGIVELFTSTGKDRRLMRRTMYHAIGPIWEANHMWLIIAVVILFVGFPRIYSTMSTYLHLPLLIMLMGIIARGSAFVFRHYDAVRDNMQPWYGRVFVYSSAITPFFLGLTAASLIAGRINPQAVDFLSAYVWGWLHWFGAAVGLFTVALCGYLASVYSIGEATNAADKQRFIRKTRRMTLAAFVCGGLVFGAAQLDGVPLLHALFGNVVGPTAIFLATLSLIVLWLRLPTGSATLLRVLAGFQGTMILLAVGYAYFPAFLVFQGGTALTLTKAIAPARTIAALGWALLLGSVFILPALFYLYYSFQKEARPTEAH